MRPHFNPPHMATRATRVYYSDESSIKILHEESIAFAEIVNNAIADGLPMIDAPTRRSPDTFYSVPLIRKQSGHAPISATHAELLPPRPHAE